MNGSTDITGWSTNANGSSFFSTCNATSFFGGYPNFGREVYASKTYTGLPAHYQVTVMAQIVLIDSWDNETFYMNVDNTTAFEKTWDWMKGQIDYCGNKSWLEPWWDYIGVVTSDPVAHTASSLVLNFTSGLSGTGEEESWGFNEVQIIIDLCDPACSACTGPSNTDCSSCNSGWYLEGTTCNTTCSLQGKYANSTTNKCEGIRLGSFFWINIFEYSM